jgi:opacity protein-like surface antigen
MKTLQSINFTGVSCALLLLAAVSHAATDSKIYFNFDAGLNLADDVDVEVPGFGEATGGLDPGFRVSTAGGFILNDLLSLEVETGFVYNDLEDFDGWLGHIPILGSLVFRYECECGWTPFIGVGGGGAVSIFEETVRFTPTSSSETETDTDFVIAWQAQAGLRYQVNEALAVGFLYKYFGTDGPEIEMFGVTRDIEINHNHYVGLHLNYRF